MKLLLFRCWTNRINPYVSYYLVYIFPFLFLVHVLDFLDFLLQPFHWTFISNNNMLSSRNISYFYAFFLIASFSFPGLWMQYISVDTGPSALGLESGSHHYSRGSPHQPWYFSPNHWTFIFNFPFFFFPRSFGCKSSKHIVPHADLQVVTYIYFQFHYRTPDPWGK